MPRRLDAVAADTLRTLKDRYNALLLDAGDACWAGNVYYRPGGEPVFDLMNGAGYDAMTVGNREFHFTLYRLSGSAVLLPIIESLWLQFGPYIRRSAEFFDGREGRGAKHHTEALRALKRRDPAKVRHAIERDIQRAFEILADIWKREAQA